MTLTVTLTQYPVSTFPNAAVFTQDIEVNIICQVSTLTWDVGNPASPETRTIRLALDEPATLTRDVVKDPNCLNPPGPAFSIINSSFPNTSVHTVASNSPGMDDGTVTITGLTKSDVGSWQFELDATLGSGYIKRTIKVNIVDPCSSETTLTDPNPLLDIDVIMPNASGTQSETFVIDTQVERNNPASGLVCNFVSSMTPSKLFISYDSSTRTYTVDESKIVLPTDIGSHTFTITIDSQEYSGTVNTISRQFDVNVICDVTSFTFQSVPEDIPSYYLN